MALTQSARLAGPSWDEEVVPALRKRLESESRTLARRMSAISLSSIDEPSNANYSAYTDQSIRQMQISPQYNSSQQYSSSGGQILQSTYQQQATSDRTMPTGNARVNGTTASKPSAKTDFQRARTYSTPYGSDMNGNGRPEPNPNKSADPARSLSPRPVDVKPTRIPKASRPVPSSSTSSPYTNGSHYSPGVAPFQLSPELPSQTLPDQRTPQRGIIASSSTQSTVELSGRGARHTPGLLNESPPFPTDSTMSSGFTQPGLRNTSVEEAPPRASTESEERPYEHWYRGEVSRNGGVGELRVGRRQEMLDIANYGHMIANKQAAKRMAPMNVEEDTRRTRKRAGSIAGITKKERERESLYLDEEHADDSRVLDEHPLTDLDGEGSESEAYGAYAYLPNEGDLSSGSNEWTTVAGAHEFRSVTPTPSNVLQRPSSRQQQSTIIPPTRIPGPSSRRSSESRSTVNPSPVTAATTLVSASKSSSPPPAPSSSSNSRQLNNMSGSAQKRGASPASKKARTAAAAKMTKSKTLPAKQDDRPNRDSAHYPIPFGDGEDMSDAIPSWTQPVPREGNWDNVVLPVVAKKKGLNGYYEDADGSPKPKKVDNTVAPAPGTFGFDGSKYRSPRGGFESIPMDEFGRPAEQPQASDEDDDRENGRPTGLSTIHDEIQLPHRQNSPSPAPFSHYAPTSIQHARSPHQTLGMQQTQQDASPGKQQQPQKEEEEGGAGCCKCVIM